MTFLPVLARELRSAARRPSTYHARVVAALVATCLSLGMIFAGLGSLRPRSSLGQETFFFLSVLGYVFAFLEGVLTTADSLSQEKREGTLGLLFLTDLSAGGIVAGKFIACTQRTLYHLLAMLPVPAFSLFLGGVTLADLLWMMLALLDTLFFAAAIGLFVSACCYHQRHSVGLAFVLVFLLCGLFPVAGYGLMRLTAAKAILPWYLIPSPAGVLLGAQPLASRIMPAGVYGWSLLATQALGWGLLGLASWILRRSWQDKSLLQPASQPKKRLASEWARLEAIHPIVCLAERREPRQNKLKVLIGATLLSFLVGSLIVCYGGSALLALAYISCVLHLVLISQACGLAQRAFAEDRASGMLELLLTTPLGAEAILRGRLLALKHQLYQATVFLLTVDLFLLLGGCWMLEGWKAVVWAMGYLVWMVTMYAGLYISSWLGLWIGLKTGNSIRARGRLVAQAVGWPAMVFCGSVVLVGLLSQGNAFREELILPTLVCIIALVISSVVGLLGRSVGDLQDHLRELAAGEPTTGEPLLRWRAFRAKDK